MSKKKTAFLSYAHEDKNFAERIAIELRKAGIDAQIAEWEIKAGDPRIQKIFVEGISKCDFFLIYFREQAPDQNGSERSLTPR